MPLVLNQILNQPSSRAGSPDVLFFSVFFVFFIFPVFIFCFVLFFCYQINIPIVRTPTSSRKPMPSVLNQILNQPSSRAGSPDVLAMAAAAAAVAQAKTELKKDVCIAESFYNVKYY